MAKAFRFDPFFVNYQILFLGGFWYLASRNRLATAFYEVYRFICLFTLTMTMIIQVVDVYVLLDHPRKLMEDLCAIIVTCVVVVKIHLLSYRAHEVEGLQAEFLRFRNSRTHPEEEMIWKDASRRIYAMTKAFYFLGLSCVAFWICFPAVETSQGRNLPYAWLFPVDPFQTPYYEIIYTFQSLSLFSYLINLISLDVGFCGFVAQIIAQYDVLVRDIRTLGLAHGAGRLSSRAATDALRDAVKLHNYLIRQVEHLQNIYGDLLLTQMPLAAVMLALVVIDATRNSTELSLKFIQRILYLFSACFDTWMVCYWGTRLQEKSLSLSEGAYRLPWTEMSVRTRRAILMIMMRAKRVPKIRAGKVMSFDLPLFLKIIKYAYDSAAVLRNLK